jgi:mRNA-degrading endonuclease RelE of RelBE toxin-antitoxin system
MLPSAREIENTAVARLALLIEEFGEMFTAKIANNETSVLDAIEEDWKKLREETEQVYKKMIDELLGAVDERSMIIKKNRMARTGDSAKNRQGRFHIIDDNTGKNKLFALCIASD